MANLISCKMTHLGIFFITKLEQKETKEIHWSVDPPFWIFWKKDKIENNDEVKYSLSVNINKMMDLVTFFIFIRINTIEFIVSNLSDIKNQQNNPKYQIYQLKNKKKLKKSKKKLWTEVFQNMNKQTDGYGQFSI